MITQQNIKSIPDDFTGVIERTFTTTEYPSNAISTVIVRSKYLNGKLHNEAGPAVTSSDGSKYWFLDDISYSEEEFNHWFKKKNLNEKLHSLLPELPKTRRGKV